MLILPSFCLYFFGISAYFIPIFLLFSGIQLLGYHLLSIKKYIRQSIWGLIWIPVFIYHFFKSQILAGGIGISSTEFLVSLLGNIGTTLLLITTFLIFITLKFNINLEKIFLFVKNSTSKKGERKLQEYRRD